MTSFARTPMSAQIDRTSVFALMFAFVSAAGAAEPFIRCRSIGPSPVPPRPCCAQQTCHSCDFVLSSLVLQ